MHLFLKKIRVHTIPANFILEIQVVIIAKIVYGEELVNMAENHFKN